MEIDLKLIQDKLNIPVFAKPEDFNFPPLTYKGSNQLYLYGEVLAESYGQALDKANRILDKYGEYPLIKKAGIKLEYIPQNARLI